MRIPVCYSNISSELIYELETNNMKIIFNSFIRDGKFKVIIQ